MGGKLEIGLVGWMILIIMISERDYNNIYKGSLQFIHI